ncbi:hypothetical protein J3E73DRAFT_395636 [Bipolaris maydis]|nr:hypothetical protein J3E73DRAFT_395636 [Bipolaris maydis]
MPGCAWKETRPGRWERPQSYLEKMNILTRNVPNAIGRDNWAKNAVAKLKFHPDIKDPAAYLQTAWKQVRYNHPEIAAFPYNGNYVLPSIFCLNHLVESLANMNPDLVFGGCAKNLTPSMEDTLHINHDATQASPGAKPKLKAQRPGYHKGTLSSSPRATQKLSWIAVYNAALAWMWRGASWLHFHYNLRVLIPEGEAPENSPTSYTSVLTTEVVVSPWTDFDSYYAQLAPVYATGYAPYLGSSPYFHKLLEQRLTDSNLGSNGETDGQLQPRFAFLGTIDEKLSNNIGDGLVQVEDFWLGAETLTLRMMVHTWIWQGQLVLSNTHIWSQLVAMDAVPISKKLIAFGSKKIYLPKFTVALVRTPKLSPYHARFLVPLDFSKYDLRDYLYHAYNVKCFNIRSYVKQMPVRDTREQPRHWFRPESQKYMTVEMEQPFVWPEIPDLEPWGQREKQNNNDKREAARKLREQAKKLLYKDVGHHGERSQLSEEVDAQDPEAQMEREREERMLKRMSRIKNCGRRRDG